MVSGIFMLFLSYFETFSEDFARWELSKLAARKAWGGIQVGMPGKRLDTRSDLRKSVKGKSAVTWHGERNPCSLGIALRHSAFLFLNRLLLAAELD